MSDVNPPRELLLGTAGLARSAWAARYYPVDLPVDWRLGYYANDCDCVLLTADDRSALDADGLAEQFEDLPPHFRCFLQVSGAPAVADRGFLRRLDRHRTVLLVDRVDPQYPDLVQWPAADPDTWCAPAGDACVVRWFVDAADLRGLRARAEALDRRASALVIDGPDAGPERIRELRTLLELMGRA